MATTVFSGPLAVGASSGPQVLALTAPFDGLTLSLFVQMNGTDGAVIPEVTCDYKVSIDGGATYGDIQMAPLENTFSATGNQDEKTILVDSNATHVQFFLKNKDPFNSVAVVTLEALQVAVGSGGGSGGATAESNAAATSVNASTSSVTLLASNAARKNFSIYNNSSANLFLSFTSPANTAVYAVKIGPAGYYEEAFTGAVYGIWDAVNGAAEITEFS